MKLPKNVRVKSGILTLIPWVSGHTAQAIYPNIYLPKKYFNDLIHKSPDPKNVAILLHEQTHIKRQRETGFLKWGIKYIFSPKFRFNEELEAIKIQMNYLKRHKNTFDIGKSARFLSSWLYLWPVSYKFAKNELKRVWNKRS